jgi:serine O-acetyltransferase
MSDPVKLLDHNRRPPAAGGYWTTGGDRDVRSTSLASAKPNGRAPQPSAVDSPDDREGQPPPGRPGRIGRVAEDLRAAYSRDPALHGSRAAELVLYPGLWALWTHRAAHHLYTRQVPWVPRLLSQGARLLTGIEIHPGARIGRRCFIDHGMGVVIGETAEIGDDVTIYHGVTLGARGFWRDEKGSKRHPTIGDGVVLGARSSVLGPVTVADGCRVGAHALVVSDVASGTTVTALPAVAHDNGRCEPTLLDYEI